MVSKEEFVKKIMWGLQIRRYKKKEIESKHETDYYYFKNERVKTCSGSRYKGGQF